METETSTLRAAAAGLRATSAAVVALQTQVQRPYAGVAYQDDLQLSYALHNALLGWVQAAQALGSTTTELEHLLDRAADDYEANEATLTSLTTLAGGGR